MNEKRNLISAVDTSRAATHAVASIIDIADDAIISLDAELNIILFNKGAERVFGYAADEIMGKSLDLLIPLSAVSTHKAHIASFANSGVQARRMAERADIRGRRKDGSEFPAEASISKVPTESGLIYTVILRDITARKQAEDDLLRYSEELARSNKDLEQFMYVASHDLQEPLRMVSNFCLLLREDYGNKLDDSGVEFINFAVDGAQRMKRLIEDLLAYSRVQRTQAPLQIVDCETVFQNVLHDLQLRIEEKKASITHDPLPRVLGDDVQLGQLFMNLLSNSIKFCDKLPVITLRCQDDGSYWLLSFSDNGIGIEPRFFEKIFLIFQRLHTSDKYPGTGIGLALCRKIVERHNGRMWLESDREHGTTFFVTLPKLVTNCESENDGNSAK